MPDLSNELYELEKLLAEPQWPKWDWAREKWVEFIEDRPIKKRSISVEILEDN